METEEVLMGETGGTGPVPGGEELDDEAKALIAEAAA